MPRIPYFVSAHEGFGEARKRSRNFAYNRIFGSIDARWPGEVRAGALVNARWLGGNSFNEPPAGYGEWVDETPFHDPIILISGDAKTLKYQFGLPTLDANHAASSRAQHATMHDDGSSNVYYYVCFGGGLGDPKVIRRDTFGTWTTFTNLYAQKMLSSQNDLYLVMQLPTTGGLGYNNAVAKIPAGTNLVLGIAQPTNAVIVGNPHTHINNLAELGRAIIALKPEGIFTYDRAIDKWVNQAKWLERVAHTENGKAFWYEDGDLIVAMGAGGAVRFNGRDATPYDPLPLLKSSPDEDSTSQHITAACNLRHYALLVTRIGSKRSRDGGQSTIPDPFIFAISTDSGASYPIAYNDNARDLAAGSNGIVINGFPMTTGRILIGYPAPFWGLRAPMVSDKLQTAVATLSAEISDGAGGWIPIDISDLTKSAGAPFGRSSLASSSGASDANWIFFNTDPILAGWKPQAVSIAGVGAAKRYYMRISTSATFSANCQIQFIDLLPYKPGIDARLNTPATFGQEGMDRAGMFPHLLASRMDETGGKITHDMAVLMDDVAPITDEIRIAVYGRVGGSQTYEIRRPLFFGRSYIWDLDLAQDDRPAQNSWPKIREKGLIEFSAIDLKEFLQGASGFALTGAVISGRDWRPTGYLWYRFADDGQPWARLGSFDQLPASFALSSGRRGRFLQLAVGYAGFNVSAPGSPLIDSIEVDIEADAGYQPRQVQRKEVPLR